jgi:hypothetical protein
MKAETMHLAPGWQDTPGQSWAPPTYTLGCPCEPCPHRLGCQHECKPFRQWVSAGGMSAALRDEFSRWASLTVTANRRPAPTARRREELGKTTVGSSLLTPTRHRPARAGFFIQPAGTGKGS